MTLIMTGNASQIVMAAPGRPMLAGPPSGVVSLSAIPGLAGWWDASLPAGMLSASGTSLTAFGAPAAAVADKSGATTALSVRHAASSGTTPPIATPRLNGLLGGLGLNTIIPPMLPASGQQLPLMDPDQGLASAAMALGSATPWTVLLVWSRPNWRQSSTAASTLLSIGGTQILAADNNGGGRLVLFPGTQQTVLTTTLTRRHTHAVILRNTPGTGVDVWLDATQVATAAPNALPSALTAPLLFLHNGTAAGGAECWFHEAAIWNTALTSASVTAVLNYETRWTTGPRKAIQILVTGQSNAGNGLTDGAWHLLAQGVAWHLGALAFGVVGKYDYDTTPGAATCIHGHAIYPVPALSIAGSFLTNPGDGSNPSTWNLGADGQSVQTRIQVNTAPEDAADIAVILWPWSESDSTRLYTEKATYESAARHLLSLERGMLNRSAASLPQVWWSAIPFDFNGTTDPGTQMQREVVADMVADPTQNVTVVLPQTADSMPRAIGGGSALVLNPTTAGSFSGGDGYHRDLPDNQRFGMLAAPLVARAILASEGGDTITAIPAGVPAAGGPVVTHVYRQSSTSLIITVQHDCGTDLIVPATLAASGTGWAVMDGGSVASPGTIVNATACIRLNATQLQITLGQALVNVSAACRLFYPYGTATIGRGNAVTDNLSQVTPPLGWNIAADLGSATGVAAAFVSSAAPVEAVTPGDCITTPWSFNMPVHIPMSTASGVALSDTP